MIKPFGAFCFADNRNHWNGEEVNLLRSILAVLLSENSDKSNQITRFQEYLEYIDVKQHVIHVTSKIVHTARSKDNSTKIFRANVMRLLELIDFKDPKEIDESSTLLCKKAQYKYDHKTVQKVFSLLWEDFLKLNSNEVDLYKRMLIILHDKVMPQLLRPLMLTDFLVESYNVGGSISLLALNGVFHLMAKYNLEYPDFYKVRIIYLFLCICRLIQTVYYSIVEIVLIENIFLFQKLYELLTPDVLHVKYRARFFHLADRFLMSTHLPEYLVAAFVKRLSRIALTGPSNALLMVLPFIGIITNYLKYFSGASFNSHLRY